MKYENKIRRSGVIALFILSFGFVWFYEKNRNTLSRMIRIMAHKKYRIFWNSDIT